MYTVNEREHKDKVSAGGPPKAPTELTQKPKRYRFVVDFDTAGFWQVRRSLHTFPTSTLQFVLESVQQILYSREERRRPGHEKLQKYRR